MGHNLLKSYIVKGTHTISDNQILVGEDLAALFDLSTGDSMTWFHLTLKNQVHLKLWAYLKQIFTFTIIHSFIRPYHPAKTFLI